MSQPAWTVATTGKRHPRYFKDDGNLHILIGETRFCIHASALIDHSNLFRDMFAHGQPLNGESMSEDTPLVLPGLSARQFEMILDIVYFLWPGPVLSVYEALALLELADKFDMAIARQFCLGHLSNRLIPPILRLHYGVKCHIDEWIERAYLALTWRPIHRIPMSHLALVDGKLLVDVMRTKALCDEYRRGLFLEPPTIIHSAECFSREACITAWKYSFRAGFCPSYLNPDPDHYMTPADAAAVFKDVTVPNMHALCLEATKEEMVKCRVFEMELLIVERAINAAKCKASTEPEFDAVETEEMDLFNAQFQ